MSSPYIKGGKMKQIPCEECISLAMCVSLHTIKCEILYSFICLTTIRDGFAGYREGVSKEVYSTFHKYIKSTFYKFQEIELKPNTDPNNHRSPFHEQRLLKYKKDLEDALYGS